MYVHDIQTIQNPNKQRDEIKQNKIKQRDRDSRTDKIGQIGAKTCEKKKKKVKKNNNNNNNNIQKMN